MASIIIKLVLLSVVDFAAQQITNANDLESQTTALRFKCIICIMVKNGESVILIYPSKLLSSVSLQRKHFTVETHNVIIRACERLFSTTKLFYRKKVSFRERNMMM